MGFLCLHFRPAPSPDSSNPKNKYNVWSRNMLLIISDQTVPECLWSVTDVEVVVGQLQQSYSSRGHTFYGTNGEFPVSCFFLQWLLEFRWIAQLRNWWVIRWKFVYITMPATSVLDVRHLGFSASGFGQRCRRWLRWSAWPRQNGRLGGYDYAPRPCPNERRVISTITQSLNLNHG